MTLKETRKFAGLFALGVVAAVAAIAVMLALPHDRYIRWQALHTEAYARLGWAYERIHDDPTPLDVAFVGTSHTLNGVDAAAVDQALAAEGAHTPDGRCVVVTNFAIPEYGRNLHWILARELLRSRRVNTLVLEVFENETRKAHPLFSHVADERDIFGAPLLVNVGYLPDAVRLPYRQLSLWFESLFPEDFGLRRRFDPRNYDGSTVDNTRVVNARGIALTPPRDKIEALDALKAEARSNARKKNLHMMGARFERYEYAVPRTYVNDILDLARQRGTKVVFLYLPGYGQPAQPVDMRLYAGHEMLSANDILKRTDYWYDVHHLNAAGASVLSQRLGQLLAPEWKAGAQHPGNVACNYGFPPRQSLLPFSKDR